MTEIYVVRHAQASFGSDDYDVLSELGHQQSEWLGDYFLQRDVQFGKVLTGTQRRHQQTLNGIFSGRSADCSHESTTDLNEFDFKALVRTYLQYQPKAAVGADATPADYFRLLKAAMLAWHQGHLDQYQPAETWGQLEARVKRVLTGIATAQTPPVLIVSSGGVIAMLLKHVLGYDDETVVKMNLQIHNTSVSRIFTTRNGFHLASFNAVPHLDQSQRRHAITYS